MSELRIFLVEDSSVIRDNLIEALQENASVQVVGVADEAAGALAWLDQHPGHCDLIVIDIFLKSGNGIAILQALAGRAASPRRMILSNHATAAVRAKCAELGADKVFDKSNELDEMLAWIRRLAASARQHQAEPILGT